ncbi:MAG TPA: amidohydrolase family protein [Candidatus Polarisedimenticolia bacterium]|jgi:hypothetical protein
MSCLLGGRFVRAGLPAALVILLGAPAGLARAERPKVYAITGARVIVSPGQVIEAGTVVLRDGLIEAAGKEAKAPADAFVIDAAGKTVTAGFIDACTDIGQRKPEGGAPGGSGGAGGGGSPGPAAPREAPAGPVHPLSRVRPERRAIDTLVTDASAFEKHRAMGFTSAVTMPGDGIFRGESALINLAGGPPASNIVMPAAGQVIGFEYGGFGQGYPSSLMGAMAAIRQTLLDARRREVWAARHEASPAGLPRPDYLAAYAALGPVLSGRTPAIFDIKESANVARAISLSREFSLASILVGSGAETVELGAIDAIKASGYPVVLPIAYPDKPKVDEPEEALNVSLQDLEKYDAAPENPARLSRAGIPFALGTCRLASAADFPANLRKALERGLAADAALAALTTAPARVFGIEKELGTIEAGKIANLVVFEGAPAGGNGVFDEKAKAVLVFVDGVKYEIEHKKSKGDPNAKVDPRGTWSITFTIGGRAVNRTWTIKGKEGDYSGTAETQAGLVEFTSVKLAGNEMTVVMPAQGGRPSQEITVVITGETLEGSGEFGGGMSYSVKGTRSSGPEGGSL